jgi:hypothetical protein
MAEPNLERHCKKQVARFYRPQFKDEFPSKFSRPFGNKFLDGLAKIQVAPSRVARKPGFIARKGEEVIVHFVAVGEV